MRKNILTVAFVYLILIVTYRFLLPFGDEADYVVRVSMLNALEKFNFYSLFISDINTNFCVNNSMVITDIYPDIDYKFCDEGLYQIIARIFVTYLIFSPIFVVLILISYIAKNKEFKQRSYVLLLSLLFPGLLYYTSVVSLEQITLMLSMLIVLFLESYIIASILLPLILYIDTGNGVIVLVFLAFNYLLSIISNRYVKNIKIIVILYLIFIYFANLLVLELATSIPYLSGIASAEYEYYGIGEGNYVYSNYPLLGRPIITFLSSVFMTPWFVYSLTAFAIFIYMLYTAIVKAKSYYKFSEITTTEVNLLATILTVFTCVFMLPGHANAKYYIFMFPIFIVWLIKMIGLKKVYKYIILLNLTVISKLFLINIL